MIPEEERILAQKAKMGDKDALISLWNEITPKLFGYLVSITRDKNLAEDILQTTWVKAIEALPRFEQRQVGISAWLFAIAKNECKQHWRKTNREISFDPQLHDCPDGENGKADNNILIEQTLKYLSEDDRELIRLRYVADMPFSDMAKILNMSSVHVRVKIHRALKKARAVLNSNN